jgi:DNA-binding NarL/FixJ family response regulator
VVRVVVVGEGAEFRRQARALLAAGGSRHLVADCADPGAVLAAIEATAAEVVVVDADGLQGRAADLAEELGRSAPGVAVILLSLRGVESATGR